ncbi:interleukin-1 receptor-like 2 [Betta splendens]|uniref:Interleukin-1 receptor-like 2 n=1 Tax=Betta splendens TaxID=158456 RepID=A0A6P7LFV2_BETSP|nr:interleukin-1 receptor-like 2 [Betta splendens]XP_055361158.1 interleukin-1 receptor-like 2 [Betta splendens]
MGWRSSPEGLLILLRLCGICTVVVLENCTDYKTQFERVFSVPGDMAMLNSTIVAPDVFDFRTIPYSITWYVTKTGQEMSNQTGRILIRGETLWFLNVTLDDDGEYETILRTPFWCYKQATKLVVNLTVTGECGRPLRSNQPLTSGVSDRLACPLPDYITKLRSYNITTSLVWYRGCDPIEDGQAYTYSDLELMISRVKDQDDTFFTCTLKFTLGGITGSVSETIQAEFIKEYSLVPQMHEPANEVIKAQLGSSFSKRCLVFVPGTENGFVDIFWFNGTTLVSPSERVFVSEQRMWRQEVPSSGTWLERQLTFTELKEKDFHTNYTCQAYSFRGHPKGNFILLPAEPDITIPIGSVLGCVMILFIISTILYYTFKVDIVLQFRTAFPHFYVNKDLDGKLYDAYVAYPEHCAVGFSQEVEKFALHTLPQVLENACGYKLFIAGRDCLPGQAIIDSVEENIQASRRLLLLYTASTFTSKRHTSSTSSNNNNIISNNNLNSDRKTNDDSHSTSYKENDDIYPDSRQQIECVAGMHRALLEGSLKVILVEMEQISPAQLALFPESVRHLRKKQGAVCWWKNTKKQQRWRTCSKSREDEDKCGQDTQWSPSTSPSSRFWKEMRYHMPVRGKRVMYPEKTALLNV